jgi:cytochrome c biogenesis protein CcdA/thiol-disulfide isomerase/thioredoxin
MIQILFAFLAGILTIAAPCILPMLPIILGASVGQRSKLRPLFIVLGFVVSFAAASLILSALVTHLGLSQNFIRSIAIVMLVMFAVFMIWPLPFELLTAKLSGFINKASEVGHSRKGNPGAFILGLVLGIVWTPCAGPVLGTILTLVATQGTTGKATLLVIVYALGAGVPMMAIAYGSQWLTTKVRGLVKYSLRLQQFFGVLILLLAIAMYFQYDTVIENKLTAFFPQSKLEQRLTYGNMPAADNSSVNAASEIKLSNYGTAPEFAGIATWINSDPLTKEQLKGKVVLIDFWTYSCINCLRTLPYITKWYDKYKDKGLVVIGVHTPEFAFEKETSNVQTAVDHLGIHYPVAQDNEYATWKAYKNQYWPAEYLLDQQGNIVYKHAGEGNYDHTENAIRKLLGITEPVNKENGQDLRSVRSPEMYFEIQRLKYLSPGQSPSGQPKKYDLPKAVALNNFALAGEWKFGNDHAELTKGAGKVVLHFSSGKVFMVAAADKPVMLTITVDGKVQPNVTVQMSQLYTLFNSNDYREHTIEINIPSPGFRAFTFTFG